MSDSDRYKATGVGAEFEPGSRDRVLRNKLGIRRVRDIEQAESEALEAVQDWAVAHFDAGHRFTAKDICTLHRRWLGGIYAWAGDYRTVNMAKGGFSFASAAQIPRLMSHLDEVELATETPCSVMDNARLAQALSKCMPN